jgi:hypothetical protein
VGDHPAEETPTVGDATAGGEGRVVELSGVTRRLRTALGLLQLPATEPELQLPHRWLDTWTGVGLITAGVERLGPRLRLTHLEENEGRASFESNARFAPDGFGVAATPWGAVQRAALHALRRD